MAAELDLDSGPSRQNAGCQMRKNDPKLLENVPHVQKDFKSLHVNAAVPLYVYCIITLPFPDACWDELQLPVTLNRICSLAWTEGKNANSKYFLILYELDD